jgi:hypothetical protein
MSESARFEGGMQSALASMGVSGARATGMAHYVSMIHDEIVNNRELHDALTASVALRDSGGRVSAGVRHSARALSMGSGVSTKYTTHAYKGGAGVLAQLPGALERAGVPVNQNAMSVAKGALEVAQNAGNRAGIAAGVLAVFHDRFTVFAKENKIELNECSMAISKLALNAAAAAAVGTTGVGLVVAALALLAQAKDTMAMYEVCTR